MDWGTRSRASALCMKLDALARVALKVGFQPPSFSLVRDNDNDNDCLLIADFMGGRLAANEIKTA